MCGCPIAFYGYLTYSFLCIDDFSYLICKMIVSKDVYVRNVKQVRSIEECASYCSQTEGCEIVAPSHLTQPSGSRSTFYSSRVSLVGFVTQAEIVPIGARLSAVMLFELQPMSSLFCSMYALFSSILLFVETMWPSFAVTRLSTIPRLSAVSWKSPSK